MGERRGSNPRPLDPQSSALTWLSYNHHVLPFREGAAKIPIYLTLANPK